METPDRSDRRDADLAPTLTASEDEDLDDEPARDSEYQAVHDEILVPKQACNRCRRRKIRCNRANPCSNCVRFRSECSYPAMEHRGEKRKRIHMSTQYEEKIDRIFKILDEVRTKVDSLSDGPITSVRSAQESSSEAHLHSSGDHNEATTSSDVDIEDETQFLSHALFASQFMKDRVRESTGSSELVRKMASALHKLQAVIDSQRGQKATLKSLYPHARPMPRGLSFSDLQIPPVEISLECLQKAKELQHVRFFWLTEFVSLSQFTEYLVNVYSPGPASNTDMIIVLGGIFWLFCECALAAADEQAREKFWNQAAVCRETLETILYHLSFHNPICFDSTLAISIAASYCFRTGKTSAAWNFITNAAHLCHALGFHRPHVLGADCPDLRQRKAKLLWSVYILERTLSLHLGKPSTFHDNDIALPRLNIPQETTMDFPFNVTLTKHIHIAALQGRVYSEIYSLGALSKPIEVRTSQAKKLASELNFILEHEDDFEKRYNESRRRALGPTLHELFQRAARINELSLLTLLYRGIPPQQSSNATFCHECVASARAALEEHQRSTSIITSSHVKGHPLEIYINWSFLLFPFFPFIVIFCHAVQTCEQDDLYLLESVVKTLESISGSAFYQTCRKQIRLFRALYDVAGTYIELKMSESEPPIASSDFNQMLVGMGVPILPQSSASLSHPSHTAAVDEVPSTGTVSHNMNPSFDYTAETTGTSTAEIDEMGLELGNWFQGNHEMLRLLDDSYLRQ